MIPLSLHRGALLALILSIVCATIAIIYYRGKLVDNVNWEAKVSVDEETRLHASIFDIASERGLIRPRLGRRGELFLEQPPCEALMLNDPRHMVGTPGTSVAGAEKDDLKALKTALTLLCTSPQGEEIRNEIEAWNASFDLLAIRDNRFQNETCRTERQDLSAEVSCRAIASRILGRWSACYRWAPLRRRGFRKPSPRSANSSCWLTGAQPTCLPAIGPC